MAFTILYVRFVVDATGRLAVTSFSQDKSLDSEHTSNKPVSSSANISSVLLASEEAKHLANGAKSF